MNPEQVAEAVPVEALQAWVDTNVEGASGPARRQPPLRRLVEPHLPGARRRQRLGAAPAAARSPAGHRQRHGPRVPRAGGPRPQRRARGHHRRHVRRPRRAGRALLPDDLRRRHRLLRRRRRHRPRRGPGARRHRRAHRRAGPAPRRRLRGRGPRWAGQARGLPPAPDHPLERPVGEVEGPRDPGHRRARPPPRRARCPPTPTARSCTATTASTTPCGATTTRPAWSPSSTGRCRPSATRSPTSAWWPSTGARPAR